MQGEGEDYEVWDDDSDDEASGSGVDNLLSFCWIYCRSMEKLDNYLFTLCSQRHSCTSSLSLLGVLWFAAHSMRFKFGNPFQLWSRTFYNKTFLPVCRIYSKFVAAYMGALNCMTTPMTVLSLYVH